MITTDAAPSPRSTTRDPWQLGPMAVCAVAAVVASFVFLSDLGRATGWPGRTAYLLPLTVDALAVAAWRAGNRGVGLLATVASITGNAAGHALATGEFSWAVAVTGGWPVVALALVVHMHRPVPAAPAVEVAEDPDVDTAPWPREPWQPLAPVVPLVVAPVMDVAPEPDPEPDPGEVTPIWQSLAAQRHTEPASFATPAARPDFAAMTDDEVAEWARRADKTSYRDLWKAGVRPDRRARAINTLIRNGVLA